jgi:uncharacterized protein
MDVLIAGGFVRALQGIAAASPTLLVGLLVAAILRYYLGPKGTLRFFGGDSLRSLPQAWLIGMLLPVCSIGVIPILREMKRVGIRPGAITAFAVSAPLFNPLSLMYGLTLSRPLVIIGFAIASLVVVTAMGILWDRTTDWQSGQPKEENPIGLKRLGLCAIFMSRELCGPTGWLTLVAIAGLFLLGVVLPHGALQSSVEQLDPWAPLTMALVAIPVYATPMLTMSQLGMMFAHGNSPGAALCLLLLGTGVNLATLAWIGWNYGWKPMAAWCTTLFVLVVACAYAVDRPLIPPGIEPAGHTHAFDIYTNPFQQGASLSFALVLEATKKTTGWADLIGLGIALLALVLGFAFRTIFAAKAAAFESHMPVSSPSNTRGLNRHVSSRVVGIICLGGLVAFSVVSCYAYYPAPGEVLEEMRLARTEVLSSANGGDYKHTLHWIPILDEWSRKLEVGYAIRNFELRPYQQMQAFLLRKKLELLEHAVEHSMEAAKKNTEQSKIDLEMELQEIKALRIDISKNARRLVGAFTIPGKSGPSP